MDQGSAIQSTIRWEELHYASVTEEATKETCDEKSALGSYACCVMQDARATMPHMRNSDKLLARRSNHQARKCSCYPEEAWHVKHDARPTTKHTAGTDAQDLLQEDEETVDVWKAVDSWPTTAETKEDPNNSLSADDLNVARNPNDAFETKYGSATTLSIRNSRMCSCGTEELRRACLANKLRVGNQKCQRSTSEQTVMRHGAAKPRTCLCKVCTCQRETKHKNAQGSW